jgi:hypothetical protein
MGNVGQDCPKKTFARFITCVTADLDEARLVNVAKLPGLLEAKKSEQEGDLHSRGYLRCCRRADHFTT